MTKERIYIKPGAGRRLKDPRTFEVIPDKGAWKLKTIYWLRRLRDGDAVLADPPGADKDAANPTPVKASAMPIVTATRNIRKKPAVKPAGRGGRGDTK